MGDETWSTVTVPVFHNGDDEEAALEGAMKTLYGGGKATRRGKFSVPPPIRGAPLVDDAKLEDEKKAAGGGEGPTRAGPTVGDTVVEEDVIPGRYWGYNNATQTPVDKDADLKTQAPWGKIDLSSLVKGNVPVSMVGAAQIYFNAAKYNRDRFVGMMDMMDVQDLPKV